MPDNIIHSDEINEMIVQAPGRIVRYGAYTFLICILALLGLCQTIEYADTEQGECIIYSDNAPRPVIGKTDGQIGTLFISDGMQVTRNQPLGIIKNSTRLNDVLKLEALVKSCLENVSGNNFENIQISAASFNSTGEFQGTFQQLYWNYMQIASAIQSPAYKQLKNKPATTSANLLEYQKQFFQLVAQFVHSINEIDAGVNLWKQRYLLTAPIDGTVVFPQVVFNNKQIAEGDEIFYVAPASKNYYAQITLSQDGYSKVKPGQAVTVKLQGRSERQPLYGHVSYVSPIINKEGKVTVKMLFDQQKMNMAGGPVNVANELKGTGMIVTEKNSLLSKIFRSVVRN